MLGFAGPAGRRKRRLTWASGRRSLDQLTDTSLYDWPRTRKAWYFQAYARDPGASVFYVKTSPFLLYVGELARQFRNAKFLFMVRNPYAACEGICRTFRARRSGSDMDIRETAATHIATCLDYQRRNVATYGERGVFFSYEAMCDEPERVERKIRSLVPELDDLRLRQKLPVKGAYDEMLTNMNARQIARLNAEDIAAFNRVFRRRRDLFDHFGYEIMEPGS